ncbi:MAG: CPBP family intramembrane metalloprotease [Rhodospirillales bacterium]|nr:CPBP family intramembrane metalloprotease [Acetobacter sp.]
MSRATVRRVAALFEVCGVAVVGAFVNDKVTDLLAAHHLISTISPFALLTTQATDADLLLASRQLLLAFALIYGSFAAVIVPIGWWQRHDGRKQYGLTRSGSSWKTLLAAALATSVLTQWPVLVHTLVDAVHPLGAMAPWRQAFFDMSWKRWQFWLFAAILSYLVVPVVEELLFRGYYQRRLAQDWGNGPAILGTACFFTMSHPQYRIANLYNITMIGSLFFLAVGLGIVFAWTKSLLPSMLAHAIINVPLTPFWQGCLLLLFLGGVVVAFRPGLRVASSIFSGSGGVLLLSLPLLLGCFALMEQRWTGTGTIVLAIACLLLSLGWTLLNGRSAGETVAVNRPL